MTWILALIIFLNVTNTIFLIIELLFKNEEKTFPALKSYEKDKNLYEFRDRLRGYLGLPRRRSSIPKGKY